MKKRVALATLAGVGGLITSPAQAGFTGIQATVTGVDIGQDGFGPADVIRLYACFDSSTDQLNVVFGNHPWPLSFSNDNGSDWFQHPLAGDSASTQHPAIIAVFPEVAFDSFLDIGKTTANQGIDVGFSAGNMPPHGWGSGGVLATTNGSWHRTPSDPLSFAGVDGKVFFAQITMVQGRRLDGVGNFTTVEDGVAGTNFGVTFNVPAPGVLAVLGIAGLACGRRRLRGERA